jgi:hypothetical protein
MKKRWGLWVLSSLFQLYKYMHLGGHFYWWRKPEYPEKSIDGDLLQVTDKLQLTCIFFWIQLTICRNKTDKFTYK